MTITMQSSWRRAGAIGLGIAVLAGAAGVAFWATRDAGTDTTKVAGGHDHSAMVSATAAATPVSISAADAARIGVTFATAEVGALATEIRAVGQVTLDEARVQTVASRVEGWVERLDADVTGAPVRKGQPLLALYSPMLVSAQEELLLARRLASEIAGGTPEARRNAEELVSSARRRLGYWNVSSQEIEAVERSGRVRRTLTLYAPVSGHVLEKSVLQGQRVMAGEPLYRIADLSTVWVEGEVFEQDLAVVTPGRMVHADFEALPGEHSMGRITYVYPTLDPETRTARVRVELPNPGLRLKPGMAATLRIEGAPRAAALTVPRSAVLATGERSLVFVQLADGRLAPRDVRLGAATPERIEILGGLTAGERVVASATFLVDAESNLGSALRGMGAGTADSSLRPAAGGPAMRTGASSGAKSGAGADPHAGHVVPEER